MCVVSFIGDDFKKRFPQQWPGVDPFSPLTPADVFDKITRSEFDSLRNEVAELKKLLIAAKEYDKNTGQPDCEMEEKVSLIKAVGKMVGVNMDEVFK